MRRGQKKDSEKGESWSREKSEAGSFPSWLWSGTDWGRLVPAALKWEEAESLPRNHHEDEDHFDFEEDLEDHLDGGS